MREDRSSVSSGFWLLVDQPMIARACGISEASTCIVYGNTDGLECWKEHDPRLGPCATSVLNDEPQGRPDMSVARWPGAPHEGWLSGLCYGKVTNNKNKLNITFSDERLFFRRDRTSFEAPEYLMHVPDHLKCRGRTTIFVLVRDGSLEYVKAVPVTRRQSVRNLVDDLCRLGAVESLRAGITPLDLEANLCDSITHYYDRDDLFECDRDAPGAKRNVSNLLFLQLKTRQTFVRHLSTILDACSEARILDFAALRLCRATVG